MRPSRVLHLAFLLILSATTALATTLRVPADQPTIQAAINVAATGDTVLVAPGTYYENIDFKGKAITVISSDGAAKTILDGGQKAPAILFITGETRASIFSGFTVQHGGAYNYTLFVNGGIFLQNSSPIIRNNVLTQNNCWTIYTAGAAPLIQNNEISATQDPHGNCSFGGGAGIYIGGNLGYSGVTNNGTSALILGNTIENNVESGLEDAGGNGGAGVAVWNGSPVIMNNIIRNNASPGGSGGAINIQGGYGVAIVQNLIYANSAGCGGGALAVQGIPDSRTGISTLIANNTIVNNTGQRSAGYSECASISQIYPWPDSYGFGNPTAMFINNIISGSTSYPAVNCDELGSSPGLAGQPTFENDILYNGGGLFFGSHCVDVSSLNNNIVADPHFINASAGDFHLQSTSPAIDHGQNSVLQVFQNLTGLTLSTDLDGNPRILGTNNPACIIDIGAYEYPGTSNNSCPYVTETLQSSVNPSTYGQTVVFTVQLSSPNGVPTGSVQFSDGSTILGTGSISSTGVATINTALLAIGSHNITATYQPTGIFAAATASVIQVVTGYSTTTTVTSSLNPAGYGQPITFTSTVSSTISGSGSPTGTISFTDGASVIATKPLTPNGSSTASASFVTSALGVGAHTITATYVPTGAFVASTSALTQAIAGLPTTTLLTDTPNPAYALQPVTVSTTVSTASSAIATGTVTFYDGTATLGSTALDANGHAILLTPALTPGSHSLRATYNGDTNFATSTSNSINETILTIPTTTVVTIVTPNPSYVTQSITIMVHVASSIAGTTGTPTGRVTFNFNPILFTQATLNANGDASITLVLPGNTPAGTYTISASYRGDANFTGSSSATLQQTILINPTTISLAAGPNPATQNQSVTLTATVQTSGAAIIAGTVNFYDGANLLSTITTNSRTPATITTNSLSVGTHTLTATFLPSLVFSGSVSTPITVVINPSDFTLTTAPSITIQAQHHATTPIALASLGAFAGQINLSCSNLPIWTTCIFRPNTVPLIPNGTASSSLYLDTDAVIGYARNDSRGRPGLSPLAPISLALLLPTGLLLALRRRRLPIRLLLFALTTLATTMTLSGCSGLYPPHTPPGTYTITVTGISGTITHSTNITLIVTP